MRYKTILFILATSVLAACADDPIIGPTDSDSGGGSYGVIHFNTSPEEPADQEPERDAIKKENPKRF